MSEVGTPSSRAGQTGPQGAAVETTAAPTATVGLAHSPDPAVSIVIVSYGTGTVILDALAAVAECTRLGVEVVVVDNPAEDKPATGDLLRAHTSGVRLVTPSHNLGFGGGNVVGVEQTTADFVCFLNPDVIVADGWLEPLVAALDDPAVGIAGPVLLNPDGSIQEAGRVIYRDGWTGAVGGRDVLTGDRSQLFSRDVDYVSAACWVVRRSEFVARGGFDDRYHPAFFEDVDYALRVERDQQRTRLVVDVAVVHEHGLGGAGRDAQPHASYDAFATEWSEQLEAHATRPESDADARRSRDRLAAARLVWADRSDSTHARRRGLADAIDHARAHPRDRVTFLTDDADRLDIEPARCAGVEVLVGDVDVLLDERAEEFTAVREVWSPISLLRRRGMRRWIALAAIVLLAGVILRMVLLRSPAGEIDADEAYTGIQSFEILSGDLPVVLGGTVYTFPFDSYVYAPFVAIFGAQIIPLKLMSTAFWIVVSLVVGVVGARLRRRRTGAVAATLMWLTPGAMLLLSITGDVAYSSGVLVTLVAFLLAMRIVDTGRMQGLTLGLFGVVAGFGFWLHPMYLATLIPMVVFVLYVDRRLTAWAWVIGGGILGCGPFLLWNVVHGFPSLDPPVDLEGTYTDRLRTFGVDLLPRAFGLRDGTLSWELAVVGPLLYLGLLALVTFGLVALVRRGTEPSRFLLPAVIISAFPIMAIFENLIFADDGRYGVITFPYLVLAAAVGVDALMGHTTRRAAIAAGAVLAVWLFGFVLPGVHPLIQRDDAGPNDPISDIVGRLDDAGIDRIAGSYWGVHPIEFAADRQIVAAVTPGWPIRFPERQRIVEASPPESVAFVFRLDNETTESLWLPVGSYRREEIGGFALYLPEPISVAGE